MKRGLGLLVALGVAGAPTGWWISDVVESHDSFCVRCHLDPETPLHQAKLRDFHRAIPTTLAAAHREARDGRFACIDCHRGAGWWRRVQVKGLAARDALLWLVGDFEEPEHMAHPLADRDCTQCHASIRPGRADAFHAIPVHEIDFDYPCVACHRAHETGRPVLGFLEPEIVLPVCRNCHEEF
ncbi:MAG: hypothetical protein ACE5IL_04290 [Myxococcota bacterium]